jgi:hypothetical protein
VGPGGRKVGHWSCVFEREIESPAPSFFKLFIYLFIIVLLFTCAYNAWVISPPCPHPLPYHPLHHLPLSPIPSIPGRNYLALISNFVEERV